jgi:hypothetical protein
MSQAQFSHNAPGRDSWRPGARVAVRNRYTRSWSPGFEIDAEAPSPEGYRVRRQSDGAVLPTEIPVEDLRPA